MALFNYECDETKRIIDVVSPNYPQLTTYEKEWLYFHKYNYIPGIPVELEYETVSVNPYGSVLNAIPYNYKSAILSGQTLENLIDYTEFPYSSNIFNNDFCLKYELKTNTTYTIIVDINLNGVEPDTFGLGLLQYGVDWASNNSQYVNGLNKIKLTTNNLIANYLRIRGDGIIVNYVIVIEGDYTNVDIPYFDGIQSVKMPVLKTTGKNLFDLEKFSSQFKDRTFEIFGNGIKIKLNDDALFNAEYTKFNYQLKPNTTYTISGVNYQIDNNKTINFEIYTNGGRGDFYKNTLGSFNKVITTNDTGLVQIRMDTYKGGYSTFTDIQIEQSAQTTPYEPYKSNILTTSEEVELRGIGDVKDELNLLTGELTQRIGEVVLDGSSDEKYAINGNITSDGLTRFVIDSISNRKQRGNTISNLLPITNNYKSYGLFSGDRLNIINNCSTIDDLRIWLQQNPITIQYEVETESVKTVDLSDNAVYSYDEVTHYDCSSEAGSLIPTLSIDVPTNLSALVSRQRATIETLESENRALKDGQVELELGHEQQEEEIISTQDAVNFLLFDVLDMAPYELGQKEYDRMAVYIANQIIRGKVTYQLAVSKYPQFLTDIDEILVNEGRGDLIVKID